MRIFAVLSVLVFALSVKAADMKKFPYIAGYTDVQIMSVEHRGIQIMHSSGMCFLNPADLSDADKKNLEEELKLLELRKAEYQKFLAAQKKQQADSAKKAKLDRAAQTKAQVNEINALIKEFQAAKPAPKGKKGAPHTVYDILRALEKKFGVEKNRNMGLRGRVRAIEGHIERNYPLASNWKNLIRLIGAKRTEVEKKLKEEAAKKAAAAKAKAEAEAAKKK